MNYRYLDSKAYAKNGQAPANNDNLAQIRCDSVTRLVGFAFNKADFAGERLDAKG